LRPQSYKIQKVIIFIRGEKMKKIRVAILPFVVMMVLGVSLQAAYIQGDGSGGGGAGGKEQDISLNYVTGGNGGGGNDTLDGTADNDVIFGDGSGGGGGARLNSLEFGTQSSGGTGGSGNDFINGGPGDDIIFGDGFHGTKSRALTIPFAHYLGGAGGLGGGGGGGNAGAQQQMGSTSKGGVLGGKGGEYGNLPGQYIAPTNSTPTSDTPSLTGQAGTSDATNYYAGGGGGFGGGTLWAGDIYYGQGGKAGVYGAVQGDTAVHTYTGDSANYYTPILSLFKTSATNGQWLSPNLYGNTWEYGNGSDTLYGGPGFDILVGLGGNDTFEFRMSDIADNGNETDAIWDYSRYPIQSGTDTIKVYKNDGTTLFDAPSAWEKGTLTHNGTSWVFTPGSNGNSSRQTYIEDMGADVTRTQYIVLVGVTPPPPTLTVISNLTGIFQGASNEITFLDINASSDANDTDGEVVAFVVKTVSSGILKIGTDVTSATSWAATTNDTIDETHKAYWAPDSNGSDINAFTVVAKDNGGAESASAVQVKADVTPPTIFHAEVNTSSSTFTVVDDGDDDNNGANGGELLGGISTCEIMAGKHRYQTQTFISTSTADRTISTTELNGFDSGWGSDNFMAVYEGVFDESNITKGLVGCNDDSNGLWSEFSTNLESGKSYTMVFTAFSAVDEDDNSTTTGTGSFSVSPTVSLAYSLGGKVSGLVEGETLRLSSVGVANINITENRTFVFDTPLADDANYAITANLSSQTASRKCTVTNGTGTINSSNVNSITVHCSYTPTNITPTILAGSILGSTKITYTPSGGNSLRYMFSNSSINTPSYGDSTPLETVVYISGADITGAEADKYIIIYEVDIDGKIVGFYQKQLKKDEINTGEVVDGNSTKAVEEMLSTLVFGKIKGDNEQSGFVTSDLNLITSYTTTYGSVSISWSSNDTTTISNTGSVTRDTTNDKQVTLTATITSGEEKRVKLFYITVPKSGLTDKEIVDSVINSLSFDTIKGKNLKRGEINYELNLSLKSLNSATIAWSSNNTGVIANDGKVTRGASDTNVTLTATASKGSDSNSTTFALTVKKAISSDSEKVSADRASLSPFSFLNKNRDTQSVTSDLSLPDKGSNGSTISWSSDSSEVNTTSGKVTRGDSDKIVKLTATITSNSETKSVDFFVRVLGYAKTTPSATETNATITKEPTTVDKNDGTKEIQLGITKDGKVSDINISISNDITFENAKRNEDDGAIEIPLEFKEESGQTLKSATIYINPNGTFEMPIEMKKDDGSLKTAKISSLVPATPKATKETLELSASRGDTVVKGEANSDGSLSHIVTKGTVTTEATSYIPDSSILIQSDGRVETTAEVNATLSIKVIGKTDGRAEHILTSGDKNTTAKSEIEGAKTTIKSDGSVDTNATLGANSFSVSTDINGSSTPSYNGVAIIDTTSDSSYTPLPIGNVVDMTTRGTFDINTTIPSDKKLKLSIGE